MYLEYGGGVPTLDRDGTHLGGRGGEEYLPAGGMPPAFTKEDVLASKYLSRVSIFKFLVNVPTNKLGH